MNSLTIAEEHIGNEIIADALDLVEGSWLVQGFGLSQDRAERVNADDFNVWNMLFENFCDASDCTA